MSKLGLEYMEFVISECSSDSNSDRSIGASDILIEISMTWILIFFDKDGE